MHYDPVMTLYNKKYKDDGKLRDQDKVNVERYLLMEDRASATGRGVPFFFGTRPRDMYFPNDGCWSSSRLDRKRNFSCGRTTWCRKDCLDVPVHGRNAVLAT